jgi:hypothetical protein
MIQDEWIDSGAESHAVILTAPVGFRYAANAEERTHAHELEEQLQWIRELTL